MEQHLYHYRAKALRVIDGDSVWLELDLGHRLHMKANCRLTGIDAPERRTPTYDEGVASANALTALLGDHDLLVRSDSLDKYGRPLVTIFALVEGEWRNVNHAMIADGHAVAYEG